jgi:hypothetical protein
MSRRIIEEYQRGTAYIILSCNGGCVRTAIETLSYDGEQIDIERL